MRPVVRAVLVILVASLGVITVAEESWAVFAGGSRLLFYYTQRSLVNPAGAPGSAATIIGITNQSNTDAVNVRVNIFNGSTCAGFGPISFNLSPRRTLRLNIAAQVSAASFPEGWVDVYAVNAGGSPIRWDQLSGKGTILDFGGANTAAATYEAAALFSDADRDNSPVQQGTVIAANGDGNTFGPFEGTVEFWAQGGPFGTGNRLVVIPVSTTPGTAPVASSHNIIWTKTDETQTRNAAVASSCMIASSLADLHPAFAANYPNTGSLSDGGNLDIATDLLNKGFVGALFETATTPSLLAVHSVQQFVGPTKESHE
jgi:hypothetical protein